jgi:hypothetical protein
MDDARAIVMKKSTRRRIRKTANSVRKTLRKATRPVGGVEAALTLGAVAVAAAFHPEVRTRTKDLALAAIDRLQATIGGSSSQMPSDVLARDQAH